MSFFLTNYRSGATPCFPFSFLKTFPSVRTISLAAPRLSAFCPLNRTGKLATLHMQVWAPRPGHANHLTRSLSLCLYRCLCVCMCPCVCAGRRSRRCRISFHLYFQELYDFELSFVKWRLVRLVSATSLQNKVTARTRNGALATERSLPKRRQVAERAKYAIQQRRVRKGLNKRHTIK